MNMGEKIALRPFSHDDAAVIRENMMPDAPAEEVSALIEDWGTKRFAGKYFEMLALTVDGTVVGSVSLYEHTEKVASVGAEIFPGERGKGYATHGLRLLLEKARNLGYRLLMDQVRADNRASIALHEKLGFETDAYVYKNARDHSVLLYLLFL